MYSDMQEHPKVMVMCKTHVEVSDRTEMVTEKLLKQEEKGISRVSVLVEPIRCWQHLFSPRLLTINLWSAADQFCMERMRCGQTVLMKLSKVQEQSKTLKSPCPMPVQNEMEVSWNSCC